MEDIFQFDRKYYHAYMIAWFLFMLLLVWAKWNSKIRFGLGLGDLFYFGVMVVAIVVAALFYFNDQRSEVSELMTQQNLILVGVCFLFLVFILLKITLLRGSDSPWDGRIIF